MKQPMGFAQRTRIFTWGSVLGTCVVVLVASLWLPHAVAYTGDPAQAPGFLEPGTDVYYGTTGVPSGPPAPGPPDTVYGRYGSLDNRLLVWFVTQQHTYFGGFVLALPIFCLIFELLGLMSRDRAMALRYDSLARDFLKVSLLAFSLTAVAGAFMLWLFIVLYPSFMLYMGGTFKVMMPVYAVVFMGETVCLVTYYYSWTHLTTATGKWMHAALGVATNVFGASLLVLANAWAAFMMAPAGVDAEGRYLGNVWHLLHSALWNPLNAHRFLADLMLGGSVVMAYAAYRFLTSRSESERAYYDWVGYVFLIVTVCALLPMPLAGYWPERSSEPASSGPRWRSASRMRPSRRSSTGRSRSVCTTPQIPHMLSTPGQGFRSSRVSAPPSPTRKKSSGILAEGRLFAPRVVRRRVRARTSGVVGWTLLEERLDPLLHVSAAAQPVDALRLEPMALHGMVGGQAGVEHLADDAYRDRGCVVRDLACQRRCGRE